MSKTLTKNQHAYYKKLLTEKVAGLGVKDEISFRMSGKVKLTPKSGQPVVRPAKKADITPEWVKIHFNEEPTYIAQNYQRNLVKRMLRMTPDVIEAFLNADLNPAGEAVNSDPPAIAEVGKDTDVKSE